MRQRHSFRASLLLASAAVFGCQGVSNIELSKIHRGRDGWQHPEEVVQSLGIEPGDRVADVGAGEGYFVPYLADAVGDSGRVYAVEVDADKARALEQTFRDAYANVEIVLGRYGDPELPDGTIDVVLIVNTYHHIEGRTDYFTRLRGDLAPAGRVAIIEPNSDLTGVLSLFLDEGHTSSAPDLVDEMRAAGYRPVGSYEFLPTQVFEVFEPASDAGGPLSRATAGAAR